LSWWNPYTDRRLEMRTRLSPGECRERLRGRLAGWLTWFPSEARPLKGRVTEAGFAIHRFRTGRHGFETEAQGRFEPDAAGTRVAVRFGLRLADRIFMGFWLLFVLGLWGIPGRGAEELPRWFPALMAAMMVLIYAAVRWSSRGDAEFLARLIRETLGASDAQAQAPID
jgi:hypothetical protein